jgi:hypothetical protein
MRRKSLLTLIFSLALFAGVGISNAQITLMDWSQQWRYLITNALPSGWSASNYNASAWPQGNGVLGFPAGEAMPGGVPAITTVLATNFNTTFVTSFYFRTTVTLTTNPTSLSITGQCVLDDGAVIYINGREITPRIAMAAGTVLPTTFATRQDDVSAHGIDTFAIASSNFVQGVNVVAVEVHQGGFNSSDVVFGMKLLGTVIVPPSPPVIVTQPQDQTVEAGTRATFTVAATGALPLTYRWYSNAPGTTNGVLVLSGTAATSYQTPVTIFAMNGVSYYVTVSNSVGRVQSRTALLTVVQDITGPLMTSASQTASNVVLLVFNETILRTTNELARWENSVSNLNNYSVHILGDTNTVITVTNVSYGVSQLRLNLDTVLDPSIDYVFCVYNLQDQKTNTTLKDCIGLPQSITNNIFLLGSNWRFADAITDCRMDSTNWTAINFIENPFDWGDGFGVFYFDQSAGFNPTCNQTGTELVNFVGTQYFRKKFMLTSTFGTNDTVSNVNLFFRYLVDDGAVFYINGTEVFRTDNMPTGPVLCTTMVPTGSAIADANTCLPKSVALPPGLLRIGTNVIAVELHQVPDQGADNDMVFDCELNVTYRVTPIVPELTVVRSGQNVILTWTGETNTWKLQRAVSLSGPWTNMVTSPVTNRVQDTRVSTGQRFYRVVNP